MRKAVGVAHDYCLLQVYCLAESMLASGFDPVVYEAIRVGSLASTTCRFRLYSEGAVSLALLTDLVKCRCGQLRGC